MIQVVLYTREDCHLCELVKEQLESLMVLIPHQLVEVSIDGDKNLVKKYGMKIPVVEIGPYTLKAPISMHDLEITLRAAQERERQITQIDSAIEQRVYKEPVLITSADRFSLWLSHRYMLVMNLIVLIYVGLPFLAPLMLSYGFSAPANLIYKGYSLVCHQLAFRSWFLFGEQPAYPRQIAGLKGLQPYGLATGMDEFDNFQARLFTGDPKIGYKVALCQRDVGIYGGILFFGLVFSLSKRRLKSLPWYLWMIIGIMPIAVDGFSQLLSQSPINLLPMRESTPFLRTITGFLFGFTTAWFGYPMVEETMREIRNFTQAKIALAARQGSQDYHRHAIPPT